MKRFLALTLVLVMVLGMIPMASAENTPCEHAGTDKVTSKVTTTATCKVKEVTTFTCSEEGCKATWTKEGEVNADNHANIADDAWNPVVGKEPTCVDDGEEYAVCPDCDETVFRPVVKSDKYHNFDKTITENVTVTAPTCAETGFTVVKCAYCDATSEPYDVLPATEEHDYGEDGKCENKLRDGTTVCGAERTSKLTAEDLTVPVDGKKSISFKLNPVDSTVKYTFKSADETIATVDTSGKVTGKKAGETTITITAKKGDVEIATATCKVTVTADVQIDCDNESEAYSSTAYITLEPELTEEVEGTVKWTFALGTNSANAKATLNAAKTEVTIDPAKVGIAAVKITAEWGDDQKAEKVVYVSFYDEVDAEVVVDSKVTAFRFDDTKVFSSVKIDNIAKTASGYAMTDLWSGITHDEVLLRQKDRPSAVAEISYSGSGTQNAFDPDTENSYSKINANYLKFTCLSKGEFVLYYELLEKDMLVRSGKVTIQVNEGASDIEYKTAFNKAITFDERDFEKLWEKSDNKSDLDYVVFTSSGIVGDLYIDNTQKVLVTSRHEFHNDYDSRYDTGTYAYDLDAVTYVPYKNVNKAYEDVITFTCVGETFTETLSGVVTVFVGEEMNFTDVKKTDYFYDAVVWAVENDITSGLSATTFGPNNTCTRAQVVTFLWRAAGEPAVSGTLPFTDVKKTDYYYDAVLWAYKNNITTGLTEKTFGPNNTVTRGQVVTFLCRALDERPGTSYNPFNDVKKTDYYYDAVLWAVEDKVTTGTTATTFSPNSGCTRGQIVTFLYRAYEGE